MQHLHAVERLVDIPGVQHEWCDVVINGDVDAHLAIPSLESHDVFLGYGRDAHGVPPTPMSFRRAVSYRSELPSALDVGVVLVDRRRGDEFRLRREHCGQLLPLIAFTIAGMTTLP